MKKILFFFCVISALFLTSCASKKASGNDYVYDDEESLYEEDYDVDGKIIIEVPDTTDSFLGDFDVVRMQELMFLKKKGNSVKPRQISNVYLVPRRNTVELTFRESVNQITVSFSKAERDKILNTCEQFLQQYEEKTLPHHKVNAKTAFMRSKTQVWYGVFHASTESSKAQYYLNVEFIDKRPYLLMKFVATRTNDGKEFTPNFAVYMSPSQIREFMEVMKQENLEKLLDNLKEKAYSY